MQIRNREDAVIIFTSAFIIIATTAWLIFIGTEISPFSVLWNVFLLICVQDNICHFTALGVCSLF